MPLLCPCRNVKIIYQLRRRHVLLKRLPGQSTGFTLYFACQIKCFDVRRKLTCRRLTVLKSLYHQTIVHLIRVEFMDRTLCMIGMSISISIRQPVHVQTDGAMWIEIMLPSQPANQWRNALPSVFTFYQQRDIWNLSLQQHLLAGLCPSNGHT